MDKIIYTKPRYISDSPITTLSDSILVTLEDNLVTKVELLDVNTKEWKEIPWAGTHIDENEVAKEWLLSGHKVDFGEVVGTDKEHLEPEIPIYLLKYNLAKVNLILPENTEIIETSAFDECKSIKEINLPQSVTLIKNLAFCNLDDINKITTENQYISVETGAFSNSIAKIVVSKNIGTAKNICSLLDSTNTLVLEEITNVPAFALENCNVTNIELSNGVTTIDASGFSGLSNLINIIIPNTVESIGEEAFKLCTKLAPQTTIPESVISIGSGAFEGIYNINYHGSATGSPWGAKCVNGYIEGPVIYNGIDKTTICACYPDITGHFEIPNTVTTINKDAFYNCTKLTSLYFPKSVNAIGSYAFNNVPLSNVYINNSQMSFSSNTFSSGNSGNLYFYGSVSDFNSKNWSPDAIFSSGYDLYINDAKVVNLVLPDEILSIGIYNKCLSIVSVIVPNGITNITGFYGCSNLTTISIPDSVTEVATYPSLNTIYYRGNLETLLNNNPFKNFAFDNTLLYDLYLDDEKLTSVFIDRKLVPYNVFSKCKSIVSVECSENVTVIQEVAFKTCVNLENVLLPASLTSIGREAFRLCSKLSAITYQGTMDLWSHVDKGSNWKSGTNLSIIHCSDGDINV